MLSTAQGPQQLLNRLFLSEGMVEQMAIHTTHIGIVLSS